MRELEKQKTNVLVTSIGDKVPALKLIKAAMLKAFPEGEAVLYGADIKKECIGKYFVNDYWQMPLFAGLSVNDLLRFCREKGIGFIIPTRDGELPFYAEHKDFLAQHGIHIMVSSPETVELCLDKVTFYRCLNAMDFPVIETTESLTSRENWRYVVKERRGAGAKNIGLNMGEKEALDHAQTLKQPVFQPYIEGVEYSIDVYCDQAQQLKGLVVRQRDYVVNGEAQITTSCIYPELEDLVARLAGILNLIGHAVIQVIVDGKGAFHIVECNCRFGGASTLSVAMGLDSFYWFLMESMGTKCDSIPFIRSETEKRQIRYAEDIFL